MNKTMKEILSTSIYILSALLITFLLVRYVGVRTQVMGSSMENTLSDGDNLMVDKITYRFQDPRRYDIIVFPFQYAEKTYYIKRIIGLPGETVYIDTEGNIFINDELLKESYGTETMLNQGLAYEPIVLSKDEYFVLGDNRNHSSDSRDPVVANIKRDQIMGKAFIRIWPLNQISMIEHQ